MKLLELMTELENNGRIKRTEWEGQYIVKALNKNDPLVFCDFKCMAMNFHYVTYEDLVANDWEVIKGRP